LALAIIARRSSEARDMSTVFVFPGQGSQSVGMMASLAERHPEVRATFAEASQALGYDLWQLCQAGPAEALNSTERTQPALLTAGVATWRVWLAQGGARPQFVAGHSLGEFTALVAAGVLPFAAAVAAVRFRGQVMQEAVPVGQGAMAAVLGSDDATIEACCAEAARGGVVAPANYNAPGQIVIAGDAAAVERAIALLKQRGAKRAVALSVSAPFHCSLMQPAALRFGPHLSGVPFAVPAIRFVSSVDAAEHAQPDAIRELLVRQLASPVRWTATVAALAGLGASRFVECGPGKVLTGLNRRIDKREGVACLALEDPASLDAALATPAAGAAA
jgi:[acyl-carrier-protein] S-malonyltransferase